MILIALNGFQWRGYLLNSVFLTELQRQIDGCMKTPASQQTFGDMTLLKMLITSLVFKSATIGTGKFSITELSSGVHTVKYELNLTAQDSESMDDLNIDITVGNAICIRQDTGLFSYPGILLEVAYNYT